MRFINSCNHYKPAAGVPLDVTSRTPEYDIPKCVYMKIKRQAGFFIVIQLSDILFVDYFYKKQEMLFFCLIFW
jgi:hypothetical protein